MNSSRQHRKKHPCRARKKYCANAALVTLLTIFLSAPAGSAPAENTPETVAAGNEVRGPVTGWYIFPIETRIHSIERKKVDGRVLAVREPVLDLSEEEARQARLKTVAVPLLQTNQGRPADDLHGFQPAFLGEALDMQGVPLRWGSERNMIKRLQYAQKLLESMGSMFDPAWIPARGSARESLAFRHLVSQFAKDYHLKENLLLAIIQVESLGNTNCVSNKCATGLMQIQPHTAGQEVAAFLRERSPENGQGSSLFSPEQNIRYGAAYLHILGTRYFGQVKDPLSREFCIITAYNSGPGRFLGFFGKGRKEALSRINSLTPEELFQEITTRVPIRETRLYLSKVFSLMNYYQSLGY